MTPIVNANGAAIPALGFGTWQLRGDAARRAVGSALDAGYRHIDTASMYGNEAEVGQAIAEHSTRRDEIFVTTKVWHTDLTSDRLRRSAEASLGRLGLDQVDLLLIHWPSPAVPLTEQIASLCAAKREGLTRHIGVSNFSPAYLDAAVAIADEPIVTNQVENHPFIDQEQLIGACVRHGVAVTSYAPLGRGDILDHPTITDVARAKGKSAAQIVLRWHVQQPMNIAVPKSSDRKRIAENLAVFDFELTPDEMARISGLARPGGRLVSSPTGMDWDASPS